MFLAIGMLIAFLHVAQHVTNSRHARSYHAMHKTKKQPFTQELQVVSRPVGVPEQDIEVAKGATYTTIYLFRLSMICIPEEFSEVLCNLSILCGIRVIACDIGETSANWTVDKQKICCLNPRVLSTFPSNLIRSHLLYSQN